MVPRRGAPEHAVDSLNVFGGPQVTFQYCGPRAIYVPYARESRGQSRSITAHRLINAQLSAPLLAPRPQEPLFQAGHAGSIPVARSFLCLLTDDFRLSVRSVASFVAFF